MNRLREWTFRRRVSVKHRLMLVIELLGRVWRLFLLSAGFPMRKEFLVLRCIGGKEVSGLFSEFAAVLGALDHYERWQRIYAGLRVDFADQGLYYDPAHGENWWEYYFERIDAGSDRNAATGIVSDRQHDIFAYRITRLSRRRGFELIDRYIRPQPHVRETVDAYIRENFGDDFIIGVHYRGTDKWEDAPRVSYDDMYAAIRRAAESRASSRYKVFVATDEKAFLDYLIVRHPSGLLHRNMFRSVDGRPIDVVNEDGNHRKGEDAVIDCLLLSRCNCLIRTASNLSLCSILINPDVPEVALNRER
jgi:hypothetical protein